MACPHTCMWQTRMSLVGATLVVFGAFQRSETKHMSQNQKPTRRAFLGAAGALSAMSFPAIVLGQKNLREPVFRVAKAKLNPVRKPNEHAIEPALRYARDGLRYIQANIRDYQCTLVKQERVKGKLLPQEFIFCKVRNRKVKDGKVVVPFSIYMYFAKPRNARGREVLYVEGRNKNKLIAHEGPNNLKGVLGSFWLNPKGALAMAGQRYPIYEAGIENLVVKLIERGEKERKFADTQVQYRKGARINKRECTVIEVKHPVQRPQHDYYKARIFIDNSMNIPVRYAAYNWPRRKGGKLQLEEAYTYLNVKLNVGFTDNDFNHKNKNYRF